MDTKHTLRHQLLTSPAYLAAREAFLKVTLEGTKAAEGIRGTASPEIQAQYLSTIKTLEKMKGREAYFQYLSNGFGHGPYVELLDGSRKLDLITGIGINFFGHAHPAFMEEFLNGITSDVMQGNLQPGFESEEIIRAVLAQVGPKSRLRHGWLFCSGTMSNETALKIIRQKKFPATRMFAFSECFAGRSTAMQEITDNPKYREGQPLYGEVHHLSFYDPSLGVDQSAAQTISQIEMEMARFPGKYAGLMIELVQGEGGIRYAPREWYVKVFEAARKAGLAVWADEIQTFGRLESLFAYQHFDLAEYFDVVTIGKLLHACMALYTEEMNPRAGLVAGTFTGSVAALRTGRRVVEMLTMGGYYGPEGKIAKLSRRFEQGLEKMKAGSLRGKIGEIRVIGGMIGFGVLNQTLDDTKKFLMKFFEMGGVAFYAGHDPYVVRCLPPFGVMKESEVDLALSLIEKTLLEMKG